MLYREIIAVCSEIHTKHINTLCGQNVEFVSVKPGGIYSDYCAVHIVTTGLKRGSVLSLVINTSRHFKNYRKFPSERHLLALQLTPLPVRYITRTSYA